MLNASPKAVGMISGYSVPAGATACAHKRYIGHRSSTCGGSIIVEMTTHHRQARGRGTGTGPARRRPAPRRPRSARVPATAYSRCSSTRSGSPAVSRPGRSCATPVLRPQVAGERLVVGHHRGEHEEDERQQEDSRARSPASARAIHSRARRRLATGGARPRVVPARGASRRRRDGGRQCASSPTNPVLRRSRMRVNSIVIANSRMDDAGRAGVRSAGCPARRPAAAPSGWTPSG